MSLASSEPLGDLPSKQVVVLPDLSVDLLAPLPEWTTTRSQLDTIAEQGGGNLLLDALDVKVGGNAANLGFALARLGAQVDLIAETDHLGWALLQKAAGETTLGLDGVRVGAKGSTTVALECEDANLMLSDPGPVEDFGPERLREEDWDRLETADAVAIVNWAQNRRGTDLIGALTDRLASETRFLYLDTGDPTPRGGEVLDLLTAGDLWRGIDAWSMNEHELEAFSHGTDGDPVAAAQALAGELGIRVDLHTRGWAATVADGPAVQVEAEDTPARRLTGAGDAWNAGNLAGHLLGFSPVERLELAHRVASHYVSSPDGKPPTAREVVHP